VSRSKEGQGGYCRAIASASATAIHQLRGYRATGSVSRTFFEALLSRPLRAPMRQRGELPGPRIWPISANLMFPVPSEGASAPIPHGGMAHGASRGEKGGSEAFDQPRKGRHKHRLAGISSVATAVAGAPLHPPRSHGFRREPHYIARRRGLSDTSVVRLALMGRWLGLC
jgi:hypothetical protein